jgi:hypothetical protein
MPTRQINVFVNEWNGELLGLFYALASGDLQGPVFANAEVLLVTFLACGWFAHLLGASWTWAFAVAGLVTLSPAMLGIATTVKGDLLAVGGFVIALAWLLVLGRERSAFAMAMLVGALALSVGAKISAAIPAAGVFLLGLAIAPRSLWTRAALLPGVLLSGLFMARYVANAIVYSNPIIRVPGEKPEPGLATLLANLRQIIERGSEFSMHDPGGPQYAYQLAGGLGWTGFALIVALAWLMIMGRRVPRLLIGVLIATLLILAFITPSRPWTFRYFLPVLVAAGTVIFAVAQPRWTRAATLGALVVIGVNGSYLFRPGDLNANGSFARAYRELFGKSPMERAFLADATRRRIVKFDELGLDRVEPLRIIAFHYVNQPLLPFLGSRAQHRIVLVGSEDRILSALKDTLADIVVVTNRGDTPPPQELRDSIRRAGFAWVEQNRWMSIALRADHQNRKHQ